jgi:hypothetical protein
MATYSKVLPDVFPYRAKVPIEQIPGIVAMLIMPSTEAPYGSSFAVTSDAAPDADQGYRHVWFSVASMRSFTAYMNADSFLGITDTEMT